ncbi:MAG: hypothetical protein NVS3B11_10550 [Collimonas sp.]
MLLGNYGAASTASDTLLMWRGREFSPERWLNQLLIMESAESAPEGDCGVFRVI